MKAHELSVGDYVEYRGKPCKIIEVSLYSVLLSGVPAQRSIEHIFPVPLTAEILEKNGWEKVGEDERTGVPVMQFVYDGNAFWWTPTNGECGCEDVENEGGEEKFVKVFSCLQICYVHQLQHALRLCGIEKDIEL